PPSRGRIQLPDMFCVEPVAEKSRLFRSGETSFTRLKSNQDTSRTEPSGIRAIVVVWSPRVTRRNRSPDSERSCRTKLPGRAYARRGAVPGRTHQRALSVTPSWDAVNQMSPVFAFQPSPRQTLKRGVRVRTGPPSVDTTETCPAES